MRKQNKTERNNNRLIVMFECCEVYLLYMARTFIQKNEEKTMILHNNFIYQHNIQQ